MIPAVIQLLLRVEEYTEEYGETLNKISLELCEKFGSIDEVGRGESYALYLPDTCRRCESPARRIGDLALLYPFLSSNFLKERLNKAAFFLSRLKAEQSIARTVVATVPEETRK